MAEPIDDAVALAAYARLRAEGDDAARERLRALVCGQKREPDTFSDGADQATVNSYIEQLASPAHAPTRAGGENADHTFRGTMADALQDNGRDEEAGLLRSRRPVFVHEGQIRAVPRCVEIRGRRWFQRSYGNTYHTAHAFIDGQHVLTVPRQYGYGDQYLDSAMEGLERAGLVPPRERNPRTNGSEALWQWRERHGINLDTSVEDVPRQRDLSAPPPPSRYHPQKRRSRKVRPNHASPALRKRPHL
jgi:hypothetical protein